MSNECGRQDAAMPPEERSSGELSKLIRKLRWIGLEDQARSLELVERTLSRGHCSSAAGGPARPIGGARTGV